MKLIISLIAGVALLASVIIYSVNRSNDGDVTITSNPSIEKLQSVGELVLVKVSVSDVLIGEGHGYKGSWLVKGDCLISVDLKKAEFSSFDSETKTLIILLPKPRVYQPRVDHEKTETWDVVKETWVPFGGDADKLRDESMLHAQRLVEEACSQEDIFNTARENAELLIEQMYALTDWKVKIKWSDQEIKMQNKSQ